MPYLVLAVGAVLTAIGSALVATGFPIIQVERGWATVIAGSTLVSGGVVVAALGLVLRSVDALRSAMGMPIVSRPPERQTDVPALGETPVSTTAAASASTLVTPRDHAAPSEDVVPEAVPPVVSMDAPSDEPVESPHAPGQAEEAVPLPLDLTSPSLTSRATSPEPPEPDDWLDRSFAEFDRENADLASRAPTEPELPPEPAPEPVPEPEPVASAAPSLSQTDSSSAVIGRYEADGTSYVMYADGSIEAQSPAGVYRFASMAELKAFIEG